MRRAAFAPAEGVAYFFLAGLRPGRFATAIVLRRVGFLAVFLLAAAFVAAGFAAFFFGFFAVGIATIAAAEGPDAIGVVTFTAPFLLRTTDAATAIRRAYFFFIAILVDM